MTDPRSIARTWYPPDSLPRMPGKYLRRYADEHHVDYFDGEVWRFHDKRGRICVAQDLYWATNRRSVRSEF